MDRDRLGAALAAVAQLRLQLNPLAGAAEPAKIRDALEKTDYLAPNGHIRFDSKHQAYGLELVLVELRNKVPVVLATGVIKSPND